jgi:charged multivesicular body protein 3
MEEMMDETLDGLDEDQDELEEEADAEVDKVLFDLTDGKLGVLTGKVGGALPVRFLRLVRARTSTFVG